jgi:hypothetical protein
MVPSFAETYEALEKVREFFYAHSVTDADRERILGLQKSYFQLRKNSAMKQKTIYHFYRQKRWFLGFFVLAHFSFIFSVPFKNEKSRVHCIYLFGGISSSIDEGATCSRRLREYSASKQGVVLVRLVLCMFSETISFQSSVI